jgi:hypothetical protein
MAWTCEAQQTGTIISFTLQRYPPRCKKHCGVLHSISYSTAHDDIYTYTAAGTVVGGGRFRRKTPPREAVAAYPRLDYQFLDLIARHWSGAS